MRGFKDVRLTGSKKFEIEVFSALITDGFKVALNGTEHTHSSFMHYIRQSNDPTSLFIRFEPDGVICRNGLTISWYVEAKNGTAIEKTAYEQYMNRYRMGQIIAVVFSFPFKKTKVKAWSLVQDIRFLDSEQHVSQYPNPFPVIDDWIHPRKSSAWRDKIRWSSPHASGTPYREVDRESLKPWALLRVQFMRMVEEYK